jgi:predicted RNA-binding protein with PIN domain
MALHIIIDGYNLIRQSSKLSALDRQDIQLGRNALIEDLAAYKRIKAHRISVVFDGANAPPASQRRNRLKGIEIRFSSSGELADQLINRMVLKAGPQAMVVTSDREVADFALHHGAAAISSPEFEDKLAMAAYMDTKGVETEASDGWNPTTKKKGPGRRLKKRARQIRAKAQKL